MKEKREENDGDDNEDAGEIDWDLPWVRKKIFSSRSSFFDISGHEEGFTGNPLRGFFHFAGIMFVFYTVAENVQSLRFKGEIAAAENLSVLARNLIEIAPPFMAMVLFSFLVPLTQWGMSKGLPVYLVIFFRFLIQSGLFLGICIFLWEMEHWPVSQTAFLLLEMFVFSLKVHSYFDVNWYLHDQWVAEKGKEGKEGKQKEKEDDLTSCYPHNISAGNWFFFLNIPTLVYTTKYPRTKSIRWWYVLEKLFTTFCVFSFMTILIAEKIQPIWTRPDIYDPVTAIVKLFIPVTCLYLATFYIVFEPILNGFAEVTRYGDREYYEDWWNSTTWDEFARKWNKQVHLWAMCHCYLPLIQRRKLSKMLAGILTFFISSVIHELALFMIFRFLRPWIFILQMSQIPLIMIGGGLKGTFLGNALFWFGMVFGPPLISILYTREYYLIRMGLADPTEVLSSVLPLFGTLVLGGFFAFTVYFLLVGKKKTQKAK